MTLCFSCGRAAVVNLEDESGVLYPVCVECDQAPWPLFESETTIPDDPVIALTAVADRQRVVNAIASRRMELTTLAPSAPWVRVPLRDRSVMASDADRATLEPSR